MGRVSVTTSKPKQNGSLKKYIISNQKLKCSITIEVTFCSSVSITNKKEKPLYNFSVQLQVYLFFHSKTAFSIIHRRRTCPEISENKIDQKCGHKHFVYSENFKQKANWNTNLLIVNVMIVSRKTKYWHQSRQSVLVSSFLSQRYSAPKDEKWWLHVNYRYTIQNISIRKVKKRSINISLWMKETCQRSADARHGLDYTL